MILVNLSRFVYIGEKRDASQQLCQQGLCIGGGGAGRLGKECFLTTLLRFVNIGWGGGERMFPDKFILYII